MSRPPSLRGRLVAAFVGGAILLVGGAAVGTGVLLERAFWASLDAAVTEEAETLASILDVGSAEDLSRLVARIAAEREPGPGKFVLVVSAGGSVLASSGDAPDPAAVSREALTVHARTVRIGKEPYRVAAARARDGNTSIIGVRVGGEVALLRKARILIAAVALVLIASFAALAWWITSRAVVELGRLADELETVEAGSLDRRLSPRQTREVDRLVAVLNRLLARLEAAMASLRRFTADAAHELRTPIAALRAHLELALEDSGTAASPNLVDAFEQSERIARLAEDLLALAAIESGEMGTQEEAVRFDDLVREVSDEIEPIASEQGREFGREVSGPLVVRGVPSLLRRLVLNVLDNAFRHTLVGTRVSARLSGRDGQALLEVTDQGPGIDPAERTLVFERFRRGRGSQGGAGLGLAICREITLLHRGEISIDSASGRGTTVRVVLPLASR